MSWGNYVISKLLDEIYIQLIHFSLPLDFLEQPHIKYFIFSSIETMHLSEKKQNFISLCMINRAFCYI